MATQNRLLTPKQAKFVEIYLTGAPASVAAKQAGYGPKQSARGSELLKIPAVAAIVQGVQAEVREKAVYNLSTAMQETTDAIAFAKLHKNSMAYAKLIELRAKLAGLLVERVAVEVQANVKVALDEARARVTNWRGPVLDVPKVINPLE
ncbi:MAG: hypothetical protein LZF60_250004 [Nitrospira sp.]|nr:terminase small subunit [Nitrospira sp.]ULA60427.1 MAG: hypothetical protein LZF60_250004 [Nitrospira sp.]